jgi:hypothetical protein
MQSGFLRFQVNELHLSFRTVMGETQKSPVPLTSLVHLLHPSCNPTAKANTASYELLRADRFSRKTRERSTDGLQVFKSLT